MFFVVFATMAVSLGIGWVIGYNQGGRKTKEKLERQMRGEKALRNAATAQLLDEIGRREIEDL